MGSRDGCPGRGAAEAIRYKSLVGGTSASDDVPPVDDIHLGGFSVARSNGMDWSQLQPKRGEILRVRINDPAGDHPRLGHEMRGGWQGERFCVIVSHNEHNEGSTRVTVAPLTEFTFSKAQALSLFGVTIQCSDGDFKQSDIDVHPKNSTYRPRQRRLQTKRQPEGPAESALEVPYKSLIDLTQLMNVYSFNPADPANADLDPALCDVMWNYRNGNLKPHAMIWVRDALRLLIAGGVRHNPQLKYRKGHVIEIKSPESSLSPNPETSINGRYMVVATSPRFRDICTLVPLISYRGNAEVDQGTALVQVNPVRNYTAPDREIAICQEIHAFDLQARNVIGPVGEVQDLDEVQDALMDYLDLI